MDNKPIFGDPSPVLTTIFATLCFCFWANTMGYFTEGATLAIGVLQLGVFVSYTCGGLILLRNGNAFGGNMFMVFATVFGGIAGLTHVIMSVLPATIPFCYQVCGLSFIVAGFLLLCMVPGMCYSSIADVISFLSGGLGVLAYGLTGFGQRVIRDGLFLQQEMHCLKWTWKQMYVDCLLYYRISISEIGEAIQLV